jgi:HAD superfamily hydrolase (TIGR01509 family)
LEFNQNKAFIQFSNFGLISLNNAALKQSIEIIRRRIDDVGTKEPTILQRGDKRILVELPGIDNPERVKELLGKTAQLTFRLVTKDDGFGSEKLTLSDNNEELTDQEVEVLHDEYINYYRSHIADKTVLFPNVFITLETLVRQNIPLAICTNKSIELTHLLLKQLKIFDLFTAVTCGDSFAYKKPDPRHLITTCKLMKADPKQAVMVGDSINDIEAAKKANMLSVGVSFGYTLTPINELSPNIIINHFNEFFDALNKVKSR